MTVSLAHFLLYIYIYIYDYVYVIRLTECGIVHVILCSRVACPSMQDYISVPDVIKFTHYDGSYTSIR